jgi:hypothetical protein
MLSFAIRLDSDSIGQPTVAYLPQADDFSAPSTHEERLEWVRQSYERFIEKVLERDVLPLPLEVT